MHAFPGGGVDPRDSEPACPGSARRRRSGALALGCPVELAEALVCAAVRELFEECGVLLAGSGGRRRGRRPTSADADWERDRLALLDRSLALSELLVRRGLRLRSDLLRPWAHWTTPVFEPRRFDTWFFVAALPAGQRARDVGGEADRTRWVGVDELLPARQGRLPMFPPTAGHGRGCRCGSAGSRPDGRPCAVEAVLRRRAPLRRVMPWLAAVRRRRP